MLLLLLFIPQFLIEAQKSPPPGLAISYGIIQYGTTQGFPSPMVSAGHRTAALSKADNKIVNNAR